MGILMDEGAKFSDATDGIVGRVSAPNDFQNGRFVQVLHYLEK